MSVSNKSCRHFVETCQVFKASHLFSEYNRKGVYVVYSYGYHFPIYAYLNGQWYGNKDKYSVSTSRQQSQARPIADINWVNTEDLQRLVRG